MIASGNASSLPMSRFFEDYYTARGVRFAKNTKVVELTGAGAVESAVLQNGEVLHCDMVVAGIGVKPSHRAASQQWN